MIYRKLKDYISEKGNCITSIFGTLMDSKNEFHYEKDGEWKTFNCVGSYYGNYDFLLDYYVAGIYPAFKIVDDRIVVYLSITLYKEIKK